MNTFVQGQRWVVDSEPELGLGVVVEVSTRIVTIFFELGECDRQYSIQQAPLTRIHFAVGDEIHLASGESAIVTEVVDYDGLLAYDIGGDNYILETKLSSKIQLNQPYMRLIMGQVDKANWFHFRRQLDAAMSRVSQSRLTGLLGVRANLIPHQLYVAWSACNRERVRVLLADEVGLGKTIEAGMILSRLLKLERIQRALIIVPDALQVQWLVELVRKFSLRPSLYDDAEYDFWQNQIHIIPQSALNREIENLVNAEFDIALIDEAHNIALSSDSFSSLNKLAQSVEHLVLLTATPEQLGVESHFARLQLLDSAKFSDFEQFITSEKQYAQINDAIKQLPEGRDKLVQQLKLDSSLDDAQLIDQVLDCHGIGRVMFRNVRKAIEGFPERIAHAHSLAEQSWPAVYEWLVQFARSYKKEKILVICHDIETVLDCENYLFSKHGISVALFHEEMNLIDRDKAAAYFSSAEDGAQILICSEMGSEGRNFQFSCHLVCLDLPDHPDVLEQRIGRLDRIGQTRNVNIHIPFAENSEQALRFHWYHEILNCIERLTPAAGQIHDQYWADFQKSPDKALEEEIQNALASLEQAVQDGRDALLELNSCRQPFANELSEQISSFENTTPLGLVEQACDLLNIHFEQTRDHCYNIIPSDKMLVPSVPGIPPDGVEVTFSREVACAREDLLFVSWDAPLITGLWEMLHNSELGSATIAVLNSHQLPEGHCLIEACYDFVIQAKEAPECLPFLTHRSIRTLALDISDKDLAEALTEQSLQNSLSSVKKSLGRSIVTAKKDEIPAWYKKTEGFAEIKKQKLIAETCDAAESFFTKEIDRLNFLSQHNPNVDENEVLALQTKKENIISALKNHSVLQLSGIRLIVVAKP